MNPSMVSPQDSLLFDSHDSMPMVEGRPRLLLMLVAVLAAVALCLAMYLTWTTWSATPVAGCDSTGLIQCDHVLSSPWSKWLGLPVSLLGALVYVGILATVAWVAKRPSSLAWSVLVALGLMAAGSALWFIGLQAVVIGHYCSYCMGVHLCGVTIGVLMVMLVRELAVQDNHDHMRSMFGVTTAPIETTAEPAALSGSQALFASGAAAVGLAILMVGQFFLQPAGLVLEQVDAPAPTIESAVAADEAPTSEAPTATAESAATEETVESDEPPSASEPDAPAVVAKEDEAVEPAAVVKDEKSAEPTTLVQGYTPPSRVIAFKGLNEAIDVYKVPVLGNPKAKHIVVEMIDYTCAHCRHFHPNVHAALDRYGDQVAFVVQHVPLSKKCNPHVQRDTAVHRYACDYARLSLGVWKLEPEKFSEFHDYLMKSSKAPSVFDARRKAMELAGEAVLLDENLKADSFRSFAGNSDEVNQLNAGLPVLLTEFGVIRGVPRTEKEWFSFLEELLDIKPVAPED